MWFSPCCWINGSDTPSALMRLRSVCRFWVIAPRVMSRSFSGLITALSTKRSPVLGPSDTSRSVYSLAIASAALARSSSERSTTATPLPRTALRATDS